MGLHVAGVISISALYRECETADRARQRLGGRGEGSASRPSYGRSALLGVIFSAGWTPCIGPILGGIIGLASVSASVGAGHRPAPRLRDRPGHPLHPRRARRHRGQRTGSAGSAGTTTAVNLVTGAMLVAIGFLMITNTFARLSGSLPLIEV